MGQKYKVIRFIANALNKLEVFNWTGEAGFLEVDEAVELHLLFQEVLMVYDIFYVLRYHFGLDSAVFFKFLE